MLSMLVVPETISSSQARPRAMDLISAVRRSAFMGRARDLTLEAGSRISLNRLAGGFVQGINSAEFSSMGAGGPVLSSAPSALGCISADFDAIDHRPDVWLICRACLRRRRVASS